MKLRFLVLVVAVLSLTSLINSTSGAVELARVGKQAITSEEFLDDWKFAAAGRQTPDTTLDGKKEFLERIISRHLLSQYFLSKGSDTVTYWDNVLREYEKSIYIQALYRDAIPEVGRPGKDMMALWQLGKKFVDSLTTAYALTPNDKAGALMATKSIGLLKSAPRDREGSAMFNWGSLFTEDEKKLPAATFTGGAMTIGELSREIDGSPPFARPTAGNYDEIVETIKSFGRERVFKEEFDKRNLSKQPWFMERMKSKKDELIANGFFQAISDTCTVREGEVKKYYEDHRDACAHPFPCGRHGQGQGSGKEDRRGQELRIRGR